jgi:hypothetical protein
MQERNPSRASFGNASLMIDPGSSTAALDQRFSCTHIDKMMSGTSASPQLLALRRKVAAIGSGLFEDEHGLQEARDAWHPGALLTSGSRWNKALPTRC